MSIYSQLYDTPSTHNKVTVVLECPSDLTWKQRDSMRNIFNSHNHVYTWEAERLVFQSEQRRPRSEPLRRDSIRFGLVDFNISDESDESWLVDFILQYPKTFSDPRIFLDYYLKKFISLVEWDNLYFSAGEWKKVNDSGYKATLSFREIKKRKRSEDDSGAGGGSTSRSRLELQGHALKL